MLVLAGCGDDSGGDDAAGGAADAAISEADALGVVEYTELDDLVDAHNPNHRIRRLRRDLQVLHQQARALDQAPHDPEAQPLIGHHLVHHVFYPPVHLVEEANVKTRCFRHSFSHLFLPLLISLPLLFAGCAAEKTSSFDGIDLSSNAQALDAMGAQVVELGPVNATIHKIDEEVLAADLPRLTAIYRDILERLLVQDRAS